MFTLLFITPHPLQERSKKYISWVGGGSFGPNLTFQQCKKYACPCIYKLLSSTLSVHHLPALSWGHYSKKLRKWFSFLKQILLTNTNNKYSNVGLGSSLRGEPGLTTFRSQGCPWKIICGLRQSDTHRGGTRASRTWQKKTIKLL